MRNKLVIITGVGFRDFSKDSISKIYNSQSIKPNIGAYTALKLAKEGYPVLIISKTLEKLIRIKDSILGIVPNAIVDILHIDLLNFKSVSNILPNKLIGKEISLVHCAGLSAGNYNVPNENPYLSIEETPVDLPVMEFSSVVKSLFIMLKVLIPKFNNQKESKVVVVSSMSAVRGVPFGSSHSSAKGGVHQAIKSLSLELTPRNIFISEILPGAVDTGLYDPINVQKSVIAMGKYFGYNYEIGKIPQMHPNEIANAVSLCINSQSHILEINVVPKGQWPNMGA